MTGAQRSIDSATAEADRLRQTLGRGKGKRVRSDDERQVIRATAYSWFNNHRKCVVPILGDDKLQELDNKYRELLAGSDRATSRPRYLVSIREIKGLLSQLRSVHAVTLAAASSDPQAKTSDTAPQFGPLVGDAKMQGILKNRWGECVKCVEADAPLAATVMMGGVLEGLLLARINQLVDKAPVFKANAAPKDKKTGMPLKLNDWTLKNYIDVAHELGWISKTTKDIGEVVRDYRNYIHPQKEYSHGVNISPGDARTLWEVAKSVARQVLKS